MIDKIFTYVPGCGYSTDIGELILTLASPEVSLEDKRKIWNIWVNLRYNRDEVIAFFHDSLFNDEGRFLRLMGENENFNTFYDMALALDLGNYDNHAYYLYMILNYPKDAQMVRDALDYDSETICSMIPDIEKILDFV